MKSIVNKTEVEQVDEYPCLKISNKGNIVLFIGREAGTCIHTAAFHEVGEYRGNWEESNFELFNGTVSLSND